MDDREFEDAAALVGQHLLRLSLREPMRAPSRLPPSLGDRALVYEDVYGELRLRPKAVYFAVLEDEIAGGMDSVKASEVALRSSRVVTLRALGWSQREASDLLGVSRATASADAARVRRCRAAAESLASRRLPRIPVPPGDVIRPFASSVR